MTLRSFLDSLKGGKPDPNEKKPIDWKEKRRNNRVDVEVGARMSVLLKAGTLTYQGVVRNVSVRGCCVEFADEATAAALQTGQIFTASLAVDDFPIPLNVESTRRVAPKEWAVRFKPPFPKELEKLEKILEPRCLGMSLREIDPAALQKVNQRNFRWFQGVNETHLFSWVDSAGNVSQQQLVFLENVVEWKDTAACRTGRVRRESSSDGIEWVKSELIDFDAILNPATVAQAKTILESTQIDEAVKKVFLEKLK
jgi:hypothetical protein